MPLFPDNAEFRNLIRADPDEAFKCLYRHFYTVLVRIADGKTHDRKASEDIVQEVFIELWKNLRRLSESEGFLVRPYLLGLVKKKAITYFHKSKRLKSDSFCDVTDLAETRLSRDMEIQESEQRASLKVSVGMLPRRQFQCIDMRFFGEMSVASIAVKLGITRKAVEKNITMGLRKLRNCRSTMY